MNIQKINSFNSLYFNYSYFPKENNITFGKTYTYLNEYVEPVYQIAKKIFDMPIDEITDKKLEEIVKVPVGYYDSEDSDTIAYLVFDTSSDDSTKLESPKMYIPKFNAFSEASKIISISNLCHEYTHLLQTNDNKNSFLGLVENCKKFGFTDENLFKTLYECCEKIYFQLGGKMLSKAFSGLMKKHVAHDFEKKDSVNFLHYSITEDKIAKSMYYKNKTEFFEYALEDMQFFDSAVEDLCLNNSELAKMCVLNPTTTRQNLKKLLVDYCRQCCEHEAQAYYTENRVVDKFGYVDRRTEFAYKYNAMLAVALKG